MPHIEIRYKRSFGNPEHLIRAREELRKIVAEELSTEEMSQLSASDVDVIMIPSGEHDIMECDFQFTITASRTERRASNKESIVERMRGRIRNIPSLADAGHFSHPPQRPQCQAQKSGIWLLLPEATFHWF